ncbi:MAG TPA: carboxypeptidase-like regulatory domain-containing protein [Chitinophagaceae bacterium]|nr:carboxypeptidase-like regulatory domain-containing protein [Chitinophagaceae bacterium]
MHIFRLILLIFLLSVGARLQAQILKGKVYEAETDSVIATVNIYNTTTKSSTRSAADGSYNIVAAEENVIVFSISGFIPDTITVQFGHLLTQYDVTLHRQIISLQGVKVAASYQADSLNRRNYYNGIYAKQAGITGRNRPADGLGITLSPASFFSKESKQKRILRQRLEKQEKETFIDHSFSLPWVKNITGLSGDSLSLFMYSYRPSYSFCRKTDRQSMLEYVNEKLKEFRKQRK